MKKYNKKGFIDAQLFAPEEVKEVKAKKFTYDNNSVIVDYAINDSNGNKISDMKTQVDTNTTSIASNTTDITSLKSSKQDTLTSGTNIKTINGESVLGSGDLTISGGSSSVNPNILINGDFKFNQRQMSAYYGPNTYGADRWQVIDEMAGMAPSSNDEAWELSLEDIETAGGHFIIAQKVENYKSLRDTDVTAHIEYKNLTEDVAGSVYLCIYDGATETSVLLNSAETSATVTKHISTHVSTLTVFIRTGSTGLNMSMKAYYIKLEQGTSYTGKYYEDWGTEQIRCQRYYQPVQVLGLSNIPATTTTLLVSAPLITSLRTKPSASLLFGSRMPSVTGNGATIACNGVSVTNISQSGCLLTFNLKTEATLLQLYAITTQCNIALDSEFSITDYDLGTSGSSI